LSKSLPNSRNLLHQIHSFFRTSQYHLPFLSQPYQTSTMPNDQDQFNRPDLPKSTLNYSYTLTIDDAQSESLTPGSVVRRQDFFSASRNGPKRDFSDTYDQVSSFNLPAQCDQTLITPVSMTSPPLLSSKSSLVLRSEPAELKLSPANPLFGCEEDMSPVNRPMKYKDQFMTTADSSFPSPPMCCDPNPHYGIFTVSASSQTGRTSTSSPNPQHNPMYSSGNFSHESHFSGAPSQQTPATLYRGANQPPVIMTPNPAPRTRPHTGAQRHNSLGSNISVRSSPGPRVSPSVSPSGFPEILRSNPQKRRNKSSDIPTSFCKNIIQSPDLTEEEKLLLRLSVLETMPWKEVMRKFNETMNNGKRLKVATLQMRKGRLVKRLKNRERMNARAEHDRFNWSGMGPSPSWPREEPIFTNDYEMMQGIARNHRRASSSLSVDQISWSDGGSSSVQTLNDEDTHTMLSSFSPRSVEEARSRATSDASSHLRPLQQEPRLQQQHQQQRILGQQQYHDFQQPPW
jgi:hypothetical protein